MHPIYGNQRYYALHRYYQKKFGRRIMKAVLDGGFTCPNIDGTCGTGGCAFCDGGSGYFVTSGSIPQQMLQERIRIRKKYPDAGIIAYFQAHTNTYAPLSTLKVRYEQALHFPEIVGLSIGTRADCLPDETLDYLETLSQKTCLTVEIGLQTAHETTAEQMNLCCPRELVFEKIAELKRRGIRVCVHVINGLPNETQEQMLDTVHQVAALRPDGIKLQLLHVIQGTPLANAYKNKEFSVMNQQDYVETVAKQLELLPPETVCERLTGDGDAAKLIAPSWSKNKRVVLNQIEQRLKQMDSYQGKLFTEQA